MVTVRQRYQNTEPKPIEAVYTFPLPADATLSGFAMVCDNRRLDGIIKEREEAFRHYDDAITAGHGAALLEEERANVFTASVGNLLPGEETVIEVQYVQRLHADEGALRWMIPTLVAPRYIPGTPGGDRTGDGWAEPTARVPDADRITPRAGTVDYGLSLDLLFDLGSDITVDSPSHTLTITPEEGKRVRVCFAGTEVALDRDVVLVARGLSHAPLSTAMLHRPEDPEAPGVLALTVVPDLRRGTETAARHDIVFLIDVSGSMAGASIGEAQTALQLCLRHLRAGDCFNIIAFQSTYELFAKQPVPFTQQTLDQANAWIQALDASGGTEMLEPLLTAVRQVPDGVVMLLTDGQVGNEEEILREVCAVRGAARVYSFGIGTNVSDQLLRDLARHTGGVVEFVYPGERLDEKVVAQFSRAVAPRVTDVTVTFTGDDVDVSEQAPSELPALVDGEPWVLCARVTGHGVGQAEIRGTYADAPFCVAVPLDASAASPRPFLAKLWATERVRDLEAAAVQGRRGERLRERIVELAVHHGVMSKYTAFLVVEQRTGERRASGQPQTRTIPVNLPAGWAMFDRQRRQAQVSTLLAASAALPQTYHMQARSQSGLTMPVIEALATYAPGVSAPAASQSEVTHRRWFQRTIGSRRARAVPRHTDQAAPASGPATDSLVALLAQQLASGLWDAPGDGSDDARCVRATARALLELLRAGVTTAHPLHGAQVRKAVEALVKLVPTMAVHEAQVAELALGVAWLAATGQRTRCEIEALVAQHALLAELTPHLGNERAVRAHIDQLAVS
jgi:Ca-activated chloride channel family protein